MTTTEEQPAKLRDGALIAMKIHATPLSPLGMTREAPAGIIPRQDGVSDAFLYHSASVAARNVTRIGISRQPALAPHEPVVKMMLDAAVLDVMTWFRHADPAVILADEELSEYPQMDTALRALIQQASPSEARLLRECLDDGAMLWESLREVAQRPANEHVSLRTGSFERAMRLRYTSWLNTLKRDVGSHGATADVSLKPTPAPRRISPGLLKAAKEIRTPGEWRGIGGEIAPFVMPRLQGWPSDRALEIQDIHGRSLDSIPPAGQCKRPPVTVMLNFDAGHYSASIEGRKVPVRADGNCFYHAVLVAMGSEDRNQLLAQIGGDPEDPYGAETMAAFRHATAGQLEAEANRFQPMLEMLDVALRPARRR